MARTGAERQAAYLDRQRRGRVSLKAAVEGCQSRIADLEAENARLRRTVDSLSAALEAESGSADPAGPDCPHPSEAVSNGQCTACGEWL